MNKVTFGPGDTKITGRQGRENPGGGQAYQRGNTIRILVESEWVQENKTFPGPNATMGQI